MNYSRKSLHCERFPLLFPSEPLSKIPVRVSVQGKFTGAWGPLPNHFGEPVLGAMLVAGGAQITVEESEPGSYPLLHDQPTGELVILDALPGVWRGAPRLYVDSRTRIMPVAQAAKEFEQTPLSLSERTTRIGLLRTRANVEGVILSVRKRSGDSLGCKTMDDAQRPPLGWTFNCRGCIFWFEYHWSNGSTTSRPNTQITGCRNGLESRITSTSNRLKKNSSPSKRLNSRE